MLICKHKGTDVAVLSRNEHCPPHVHAGQHGWDARFIFSFWHNNVNLWDVVSRHTAPSSSVLEELRLVIEDPASLNKARACWWYVHSNTSLETCLNNKYWDPVNDEVVDGKNARKGMRQIQSAMYNPALAVTTFSFIGGGQPQEIQL